MAVPEARISEEISESKKPRGVTVVPMRARGVVSQPEHRHRARPAEKPFLLEHDILKVTNVDNVDWEFKWDRRKYLIKKGATGYVPFPALIIKMGDPRSVEGSVTRFNTDDGQRGIIAERHDSITTLFAHYGITNEDVDALVDFAPKLEVRTMDGDELVNFPAQDPNMTAYPVPQVPQPGRENSDTRRQMDELRAENAASREELAELRSLVRERLGNQDVPVGRPDPRSGQAAMIPDAVAEDDELDPLAQALAGAPVDQGPSAQFG